MGMSVSDTQAPELTGLAFTPAKIDTSAGSQAVTVQADVTDTPAGVDNVQVRFRSPSGGQFADAYFSPGQLVAGDAYKGTYEATVTFPQFSEQGVWNVEYVFLLDQVGNNVWLQTTDIKNLGFPYELAQKGKGDTTAPILDSLKFAPAQ